jgi:regulator of ribonuclease activity A
MEPQSDGDAIVTADLFDRYPDLLNVCDVQFRSFGTRRGFYGPCVTLKVFEDHRPVLAALQSPGRGRILVIDAGGSLRVGVLGDRLAAIGMKSGWIGTVIFGAVRDTAGIDKLAFGVKALGATARRGERETTGIADVPVTFGNCVFEPGDWVYADIDAVTVSKSKLALDEG